MDKLRKIGERLWYNKERIVLVLMVMIFCWNLYKVARPPEQPPPPKHLTPKDTMDADWDPVDTPLQPQPRQMGDWKPIHTPNPFWYYSTPTATKTKKGAEPEIGIRLVKIKKVRDKYRAQLETANATKWYDENDKFESFELLRINPDAGTCEVYAEQVGRVVTLKLPGE